MRTNTNSMPRRSERVPVPRKEYEEKNEIRHRKPKKRSTSKGNKKNLEDLQKELKECNETVFTLIKRLGRANAILRLASQRKSAKLINGYRTN